ncbi:MAG: YggS family pyridoxal phosphate-dependent enzyme [Acidithiobacillus sp.]|nr:YggS family pyridoxal phosphate-dependent enzyme [Acidithiobacillus sp.]
MDLSWHLQRIQEDCASYPGTLVLAVSKRVEAQRIRQAYALGLRHFGENYVQEALNKQKTLGELAITWHFIGQIQRNKTEEIARHFHWVESLDREILVPRLGQAREGLPPLQVLIEVAISGEQGKGGVPPAEIAPLAEAIVAEPNLALRGLMALVHRDPAIAKENFRDMKTCFDKLRAQYPHLSIDTLSMGTSGDYAQALAAGATEIRLGTALFGERSREASFAG